MQFTYDVLWSQFLWGWSNVQARVHSIAKAKGWWDQPREDGTCVALMHSELSEGLEALRDGNPPSEKIPAFSAAEEELADVIIRIMDYAEWRNYNLAGAIRAKIEYNTTRPHLHGGKAF